MGNREHLLPNALGILTHPLQPFMPMLEIQLGIHKQPGLHRYESPRLWSADHPGFHSVRRSPCLPSYYAVNLEQDCLCEQVSVLSFILRTPSMTVVVAKSDPTEGRWRAV